MGGRKSRESNDNHRFIGIAVSWPVWFLALFLVTVLGTAAAAPVVTSGDYGGSWSDDFRDGKGIEGLQNLMVEDGWVELFSQYNQWEKKGIAVHNGDPYDLLYADNPCVLKENGQYRMWYSGYNGGRSYILYASSSDGVNWVKREEPIMSPGRVGDYDRLGSNAPKVLKDGSTYKMWYTANDTVNAWAMYSTSHDGFTWSEGELVFQRTGVRINCVIKDEGTYKMWFQDLVYGNWRIFYATSSDGKSWSEHGTALEPGEPDDMHTGGVSVLKMEDGSYSMWYSNHNGENGYRIFHATSQDGEKWTKQGMVIDKSHSGQDQDAAANPWVIRDDDGTYKMWYSGNDGKTSCVMHAVELPQKIQTGDLISKKISLSPKQTWDELTIDKTEPGMDSRILVSILDGKTFEAIEGFEELEETEIDLSRINSNKHPSIRLKAVFEGDVESTPILNKWEVTWVADDSFLVEPEPGEAEKDMSNIALPAAIAGIMLLFVVFVGCSGVGRGKIIHLISPLYARFKW